jgi:hypothetical protein
MTRPVINRAKLFENIFFDMTYATIVCGIGIGIRIGIAAIDLRAIGRVTLLERDGYRSPWKINKLRRYSKRPLKI